MESITLKEALILHNSIIEKTGGAKGLRDLKLLESSLAQPYMTFNGKYLYKSVIDKPAALGYSIIMNHPFIDGNKRTGHAMMEIFLFLDGYEIKSTDKEQETLILK